MFVPVPSLAASEVIECAASMPSIDYQTYLSGLTDSFSVLRGQRLASASEEELVGVQSKEGLEAFARYRHLEWDTDCFGFKVAKLDDLGWSSPEALNALLTEMTQRAADDGVRLLSVRVGFGDYALTGLLEKHGFSLVDVMNVFGGGRELIPDERRAEVTGVAFEENGQWSVRDVEAVKKLSIGMLAHGRVGNDPVFRQSAKDKFYGRMAESFAGANGAWTCTARSEGEVVGFVLGSPDDELTSVVDGGLGYLSMIAVDASMRGRGVGNALFDRFLKGFSRDVGYIEIATQAHNYPALNLYSASGLGLVSSIATFHLWLG